MLSDRFGGSASLKALHGAVQTTAPDGWGTAPVALPSVAGSPPAAMRCSPNVVLDTDVMRASSPSTKKHCPTAGAPNDEPALAEADVSTAVVAVAVMAPFSVVLLIV